MRKRIRIVSERRSVFYLAKQTAYSACMEKEGQNIDIKYKILQLLFDYNDVRKNMRGNTLRSAPDHMMIGLL